MLANHSASDTCAFCYYKYADIARHTPPLAENFGALELVRQSLERILEGLAAYGMPGHLSFDIEGKKAEHGGHPTPSLDIYPSLLIAVHEYVSDTGDKVWLERNYGGVKQWAEKLLATDRDGNGLFEYPMSGDSGSWPPLVKTRPANWWDTIGFGHEDAYSNALAYRALRGMEEMAVQLLALEAIYRQYRSGGLSAVQMDELKTRLDRARKGLPGAVWAAYTVTVAPSGTAGGDTTLWMRQEHGFAGYRPGEHSVAKRVWDRLVDEQRLLERLDPRLISEGKGDQWRLWQAENDRINVATLWDYFCKFPYLPMLTGPEAMQHTISWGVQRSLFGYALGDDATFDTMHFSESIPSGNFAIIDGAWLLRPALVEQLLEKEKPPITIPEDEIEPEEKPAKKPGPAEIIAPEPPPSVYQRVTIDTPVDWRQLFDFYNAVIKPLADTGADVVLHLRLEATGEIDANLVDLSVKESVLQFNPQGRVDVE